MLREIFTTVIRSFSRTIGRIIAYAFIGFLLFLLASKFYNAETLNSNNSIISSDYVDYFGRVLESKPIDTDYLAFSHDCSNSTCFTLLTGDIELKKHATIKYTSVDALPEASFELIGDIYLYDNKYYTVEEVTGGYTPIPLNENLNGKTIYVKDLTPYVNDFDYSRNFSSRVFETSVGNGVFAFDTLFGYNRILLPTLCDIKTFGSNKIAFEYRSDTVNIRSVPSFLIDVDCNLLTWNTYNYDVSGYFSLTPFEPIYTWKQVDVPTGNSYFCNSCDYITFNSLGDFSSGVYDNLEITGEVLYSNTGISLERGNTYEKVSTFVIVLFLSIFICGLFLCIYHRE